MASSALVFYNYMPVATVTYDASCSKSCPVIRYRFLFGMHDNGALLLLVIIVQYSKVEGQCTHTTLQALQSEQANLHRRLDLGLEAACSECSMPAGPRHASSPRDSFVCHLHIARTILSLSTLTDLLLMTCIALRCQIDERCDPLICLQKSLPN